MNKILLVDDEEAFRHAARMSLESKGYEVTVAENGRIANDLLYKGHKFGLVISDIRMPEMSGIELTRAIRTRSQIPIILVTGFSELTETREAYLLGANEFIPKPFKRDDLIKAVERCFKIVSSGNGDQDAEDFCKLGIADFATGRQINFNIFIRMAPDKFIKVAHKGEDISVDRIRHYRQRGLSFLYLRHDDFRKYVGFSTELATPTKRANAPGWEKKMDLLRHTGEILASQIRHEGVDQNIYETAVAFVEASLDALTDDVRAIDLFEALRRHSDHILAHSVGVSLYSVLIAQLMNWSLPTNRFKVAIGGLLHDIGQKEVDREILVRPKESWSPAEVQLYESHPSRGLSILDDLESIPDDVREIVKQHHENCLARGFPAKMKKANIHPMAKLISVADEFCYRIVRSPGSGNMAPLEAIQDMMLRGIDQLDKSFFEALTCLFKGS